MVEVVLISWADGMNGNKRYHREEWLKEQFRTKTAAEIAEECGVAEATIMKYSAKFDFHAQKLEGREKLNQELADGFECSLEDFKSCIGFVQKPVCVQEVGLLFKKCSTWLKERLEVLNYEVFS